MNAPERRNKVPIPISVEEFDRKAEAGEDIDDYVDWESVVLIQPGEISAAHQASIDEAAAGAKQNVPVPSYLIDQLKQAASRQGVTLEDLVRHAIVQHLEHQEA